MFAGIFWTACGLLRSLILCWSSVVFDGFAAFPIQFQFQFLRLPPSFLFNLKFQSVVQYRVASLLQAQIMIWRLNGNLRTVKFENMDIWDQLEGLVYQIINIDTYNLIKKSLVLSSISHGYMGNAL